MEIIKKLGRVQRGNNFFYNWNEYNEETILLE